MVQSAVRLPRSLHERLKKAGGERGMGEEIRRRLEASFEAEKAPNDPKTRKLLDAISSSPCRRVITLAVGRRMRSLSAC